jgi:hypothetical protein
MTHRAKRRRLATLLIAGEPIKLDAPGLKAMKRSEGRVDLYWVASKDAVERGYPTKTRRIYVDLSVAAAALEIESICRAEQSVMQAWLDDSGIFDRQRLRFDGTLGSLINLYASDPDSSYRDLRENTAQAYDDTLKVVRNSVGARRLDRLKAKDFRRWYRNWKAPVEKAGPERVRRAYGAIQLLRIVLSYGVESDFAICRKLRTDIEKMRFARNPPRDKTLTFSQVEAFVAEALTRGELGLALAQALQFECMLRQGDVIGAWRGEPASYKLKPGEIRSGVRVWKGLTWEQITLGSDLVIRTSKTGQPVVHALSACQLVKRGLESVPDHPTEGPIVTRKDGLPWMDRRSFGKLWREVATAAGVPRDVWNLDNRASGISEASEAGAADDDIARNAAHADKAITRRVYKRLGHESSVRVNESRVRHREKKGDQQ